MPVFRSKKPSLASGRVSERLVGRVDLEQYATGCEAIENFVVFPHGGATFRSGSYFVNEVKNSASYVRLIPFVFSNTQSYILETGSEYMRVYFDHAPLLDGMGAHVEIATPWTTGEIDDIDYAQSGDILYCVQANHQPREVRRTGPATWSIGEFANLDGPYYDLNVTTTTFTLSATSGGSVTLTASSVNGINGGAGFQDTDVGRHVRILHSSTWGWGIIAARSSTTVVTISVQRNFASTTASANWRLGAWSGTDGYPEAVVFHQQRLWFFRGEYMWGSKTADFVNFAPSDVDGTVTPADAVTYRLGKGNFIRWAQSARTLEVGLESVEYVLSGAEGVNGPLVPTSPPRASKESEEGSAPYSKPITTNNGTVFLNRTGRKLINYYYSFQKDGYEAQDITILAEDITFPSVLEIAYQAEPDKVIWAVTSDGNLLACTFDPKQEVTAWQNHRLGGTHQGAHPKVESVAVIPAPDGTLDEVWLSVLRDVDGKEFRSIEYLMPLYRPIDAVERDAFYVDCGLTYDDPDNPVSVVAGLEHLEGEEVAILVDGKIRPNAVVEGGEVDVGAAGSFIHVGLPYKGEIILLPIEPQGVDDPITSRRHRIKEVGLLFYRTVLAKVGLVGSPMEEVGRRTPSDPLGGAIQPKTDYRRIPVGSTSEYRNKIRILQDKPLPCTILGITAYMDYR